MPGDFNTSMRKTEEVIRDLKSLISSKGYVYTLCMILFEDFHINPEKLHEIDWGGRLNSNEASLLLGFLVQDTIDFSTPDDPMSLIQLKQRTYELMEELHQSFNIQFLEKLEKEIGRACDKKNYRKEMKDFFGKGNMLAEPIFYSGSGAYDFQYLEFLDKKYKYDEKWLHDKKQFDFVQVKRAISQIKEVLKKKSEKVYLRDIKEKLPEVIEGLCKKDSTHDWETEAKKLLPMLELHQYVDLFFENKSEFLVAGNNIREAGWNSFYKSLIELFVVEKTNFESDINVDAFFSNFSIIPKKGMNSRFQSIGDYNVINSHPIIQLDGDKYFIPIPFLLSIAVYESPYYWMIDDKAYIDQAGSNRGEVGGEIVYNQLQRVFGENRTFKSVKITTKKGYDATDIDVLCILGSKALCVQVKSKKLTELSRKGNDAALQKDFKGAVQDAYEQGVISRNKILERTAKFTDEFGKKIKLSEEIDDVYIMGVTTEDYPALTHQAHVMLEKEDQEPSPIFLTVFDLELLVHYLDDPYDFLYYIRQRISCMGYFVASDEMAFLGFHLDRKLWKDPNIQMAVLDGIYAQLIDRNYYPLKLGLAVSSESDPIKKRWTNETFNKLCNEIKVSDEPKITDILFYLFDWSGGARDKVVEFLINAKQKTFHDGGPHNFTMLPDSIYSKRVGITYYSLNSDDVDELNKSLLSLCQLRKYRSKGDVWIGIGGLLNSTNMVDTVVFNDYKWEYDKKLEEASQVFWGGKKRGIFVNFGKKVNENDICPCGSGLKYGKCCGKD